MDKIKLTNDLIISIENIELINGTLTISIREGFTVDELITIFSDINNTSVIAIMTEDETEVGMKIGFTSFAGINYHADGLKIVELFQPVDETEARLAQAEAATNLATSKLSEVEEQNEILSITVDSILTEIIPSLMGEEIF